MGKEMGNNYSSAAIKEEDNISEVDNKNLIEDTSEHANEILREENKNLSPASSLTKDIPQDVHDADNDVKGKKTQTISISEASDAYEINMKNQMQPKAEVENVKEKTTTELGQVLMQEEIRRDGVEEKSHEEIRGDDVKEKIQSISTAIFANGGYETRDSVTRLSTESNPDNLNITSQMQKSPSFNLNLRIEPRRDESDQIPLLCESANDSLSNKLSQNLSNSMPHDEYDHIEEKIVTMEKSYSEISKSSSMGFSKENEETTDRLVMEQTQDNNAGSKMEVLSSTSPKEKEKHKSMSYFFTSCLCCATLPN